MKIVIWGHKLHSHTHSYVHHGFFRAFQKMGYETLWFDDSDDVSNINFDNSLFLTEGQVDKKIPVNNSSKYILHNCAGDRYQGVPENNKLSIQTFHKSVLGYNINRVNDYTYVGDRILYQPWATDLLPDEFSEQDAHNELNNKVCVWIGSYDAGNSTFQNNTTLGPFFNECKKAGIHLKMVDPWGTPVSPEENRSLVHNAFAAPAIQGQWQIDNYYLPCRIFKHISYGHYGITNNEYVNKIFDNKLIFNTNTSSLFHQLLERKNNPDSINEIKFLINEVKEKHTFISRIKQIIEVV